MIRHYSLSLSLAVALISCHYSTSSNNRSAAGVPAPEGTLAAVAPTDSSPGELTAYLHEFADKPQQFSIKSGTTPQTIRGKKGTRITLAASDLEGEDGSAAEGPVTVTLLELGKQADFLRNGTPTTSDGRLLASGGACYIGCTAAGKPLRLKRGKTISAVFPKTATAGMELFYGQKDEQGLVNWKPANKPIPAEDDSITIKVPVYHYRDSVLAEMNEHSSIDLDKFRNSRTAFREKDGKPVLVALDKEIVDTTWEDKKISALTDVAQDMYGAIQLSNLGWINCDRFLNLPQTTIAYQATDSVGATCAYLVFQKINSVAQQYTPGAQGAFGGVPPGEPVKLIVVGWQGGKPVAAAQEFTIQKNQQVTLALKPVSKQDILGMMGIKVAG